MHGGDEGLACAPGGVGEDPEDLLGARGVEGGDGLVGDDDGGVLDEDARHGDALLLAAGEKAGAHAGPVGDADLVESRHAKMALPRPDQRDDGLGEAPAPEPPREDVVQRREIRHEVELLVDHADLLGELAPRTQAGEVLAPQADGSLARRDLAGDHGQQRRLAAAAGAEERNRLALLDAE